MKFEIKNRFTGNLLFSVETDSWKLAVEAGIKAKADLSKADLSWADLSWANLSWANLSKADLSWANLSKADLSEADLSKADLSEADLSEADLSKADLSKADLSWANLSKADLSEADLSEADLSKADLSWANLPAPTMVLLARWLKISTQLTADLMLFDSTGHPNPAAFESWAKGGSCPYAGVQIHRMAHFQEVRELWGKGNPDTIYNLMVRLLREKCKTNL